MGSFMFDYTTFKEIIVESLYSTYSWPQLAILLTGNITDAVAELDGYVVPLEEATQMVMAVMGINCGDRSVRASSFNDFFPAIDQPYHTSKLMGDLNPALSMMCAQWKIEPKERYEGDFKVRTKKSILLIGNTHDGLTPLILCL